MIKLIKKANISKIPFRQYFMVLLCIIAVIFTIPLSKAAAESNTYASRTVRVGWFNFDGYQVTLEDGTRTGYDYDYLKKISEYSNWNYEFVEGTWAECLQMLIDGELDILSSVQIDDSRDDYLEYADISSGICSAQLYALENNTSLNYQDYDSFDGIVIGCNKSSYQNGVLETYAEKNNFDYEVRIYNSPVEQIAALKSGEIDAMLTNSILSISDVRIIGQFGASRYYYAVSKSVPDCQEILGELNFAMESIYAEVPYFDYILYSKYYSDSGARVPGFTNEELAYIEECDVINVALYVSGEPIASIDSNGKPIGIAVDVLELIGEKTGLTFEIEAMPAGVRAVDYLEENDLSLVTGMLDSSTVRISHKLAKSNYYYSTSVSRIMRKGEIYDPDATLRMAVTTSNIGGWQTVCDKHPNITPVFFDTNEDAVYGVINGEADFFSANVFVLQRLITQTSSNNMIYINSAYATEEQLFIGALQNKDNMLLRVINKSISSIRENELNAIIANNTAYVADLTLDNIIKSYPIQTVIVICMLFLVAISLLVYVLMLQKRRNDALLDVAHQTLYDSLTNIYNKQGFFDKSQEMLDKYPNIHFVLVCFDISRFKIYNSIYGTKRGDNVLVQIAENMRTISTEKNYTFGRIGSDYFAFCYPLLQFDTDQMIKNSVEFLKQVSPEFELITNFGIYIIDDKSLSVSKMYDRAREALRAAKKSIINRYAFYDDKMLIEEKTEQFIISEMNNALNAEQFVVYLQPQYSVFTGKIVGAEALVRWKHPTRGLIPPNDFIPVFEKNGFITKLDHYVWRKVAELIHKWIVEDKPLVPVSVNLSRIDTYASETVETLIGLLKEFDIPINLLSLEITESAYVESPDQVLNVVEQLHDYGFTIEMDDFGSGYSSLNSLKDLPVDVLKLDLKFLATDIEKNARSGNILDSIVRMAKWMNLIVIAEGVETIEQANYLRSIGCEIAQGYLFSRPIDIAQYEKLDINSADHLQLSNNNRIVIDDEFFKSSAVNKLLFSNMLGAIAIFEYTDKKIELFRANASFYKEIGRNSVYTDSVSYNLFDSLVKEDADTFLNMLEGASKEEFASCVTRWNTQAGLITLNIRVCIIGENNGRGIYYCSVNRLNN